MFAIDVTLSSAFICLLDRFTSTRCCCQQHHHLVTRTIADCCQQKCKAILKTSETMKSWIMKDCLLLLASLAWVRRSTRCWCQHLVAPTFAAMQVNLVNIWNNEKLICIALVFSYEIYNTVVKQWVFCHRRRRRRVTGVKGCQRLCRAPRRRVIKARLQHPR